MSFFNRLTKGISSNTGLSQANPEAFRIVNPNGPRPVTLTGQTVWSQEELQNRVEAAFQREQALVSDPVVNLKTDSYITGNNPTVPGANPYGVQREPWVFAVFKDVVNGNLTEQTKNALVWYANPKMVTWNISQRASEVKTKGGTVLHAWRDRERRSDFDDPKITITFQSGNIMPAYNNGVNPFGNLGAPDAAVSQGLNNFYQFMELVDQSKISNGQANTVHILYRSRIFPSMLLTGFFDPQSVVSFTDDSSNPFQINSWSSTFTIYNSTPRINRWQDLKKAFEAEFATDMLSRPVPSDDRNKSNTTVGQPSIDPSRIS
jgi:hypothetical protein